MKVFLHQRPELIPPASGIGRVVWSQYKHLALYGVELVADIKNADVIASHTDIYDMPRVDCIHLHGLYWNGDPDSGEYSNTNNVINKRIISAIRKALVVTVPSEWVAEPFRRDMRLSPIVIPHGIDIEDWKPSRLQDYILWGKNREGDVCNPEPAWEMANRGFNVVSTFAPPNRPIPQHMSVTGRVPGNEMRDLLAGAYMYLATVKETFGIQTLEAMACGAPVLGFDWGGTRDLVQHKVNGYLVRPYDYDALEAGAQYIHAHRTEMSAAARHTAEQYSWEHAMRKYVECYQMAAQGVVQEARNDGVAVIVTSYNYAHWLGEALRSLYAQQMYPSEVIVVDDASPDNTSEIAEQYRAQFEMQGVRYKVIRHESNQGVAMARNRGIKAAQSPFIVCLDADDRLNPLYLRACRDALVKDRGCGIAYSGLGVIQPDGNVHSNVWTGGFDWEHQAKAGNPPNTTIPTGAMFRRSMWERSGGYRQKYAPGEDAEFYTRGLSLGFTATKVSESPLIEYRMHSAGAHLTRRYVRIDDDKPWMRDRLYPLAAPSERPPLVRSYSEPIVAVYITDVAATPIGEVKATIESVNGQTWREWELVIADDINTNWPFIAVYPFIHTKKTAPLCVSIKAGTVLPYDYLENALKEYVALDSNREWDGGELMSSCCGGLDPRELAKIQMLKQGDMRALEPMQGAPEPYRDEREGQMVISGDSVRMEYIGPHSGASTFFGRNGTNRKYRGGNNAHEKYEMVHKEDVEKLTNTGDWRVVRVTRNAKGEVNVKPAEPVENTRVPASIDFRDRVVSGLGAGQAGRITLPEARESVERTGLEQPTVEREAQRPQEIDLTGGYAQADAVVTQSVPVIPKRFERIAIPDDALGDLAQDAPIEVVPPPKDEPAPVLPKVGRDDEWPTQETEAKIRAETVKRNKK